MIVCLGTFARQIKEVLQVILELSDKILREFYDLSVPIRFAGGEMEYL